MVLRHKCGLISAIFLNVRWSSALLLRGAVWTVIQTVIWSHPLRPVGTCPAEQTPEPAGKVLSMEVGVLTLTDKQATLLLRLLYVNYLCCERICRLSAFCWCLMFLIFFCSDTMTGQSKPVKPNGKLEVQTETPSSPPRTTLLGTIFSPVFSFFSPANKNGKDLWSHLSADKCMCLNDTKLVRFSVLLIIQKHVRNKNEAWNHETWNFIYTYSWGQIGETLRIKFFLPCS